MATLEFTAGAITSTITASNTKAATVFRNVARLNGYSGNINDNQAVADFVMDHIKTSLTRQSRQYQAIIDEAAARDAVQGDTDLEFEV